MKLHWYCLSFSWTSPGGSYGNCCSYNGYTHKDFISKPMIEQAKKIAAPNVEAKNVVLIAATYLGLMSVEQFNTLEAGDV